MAIVDVFFLIVLFVVQPLQGGYAWRRLMREIEAGRTPNRLALYAQTGIVEWIALGVLLAFWALLGRPWAWLGIHAQTGFGFTVALLVALALMAGFVFSAARMGRLGAAERREVRESLGDLRHFLPQTDRELKGFFALSVTAGVVEELLYRGFVLWALSQWMPLWSAVLVSSVAFGLAHSYQGVGGMLRTGLVGLAFALLFIGSGSIWLPIVFHALFDIVQGMQLRGLFRDGPALARPDGAG